MKSKKCKSFELIFSSSFTDLGAEETLETVENMQEGEIIEANLGRFKMLVVPRVHLCTHIYVLMQCCGAGAGGAEIIWGPGAGAENNFEINIFCNLF